MVGRRGENFGVEKRWKKKIMRAGRMEFSFIRKTASTGSSATGALVAAGSLQPNITWPTLKMLIEVSHEEPNITWPRLKMLIEVSHEVPWNYIKNLP